MGKYFEPSLKYHNTNTTQNKWNKSKLTQGCAFKMTAKGLLSRCKI